MNYMNLDYERPPLILLGYVTLTLTLQKKKNEKKIWKKKRNLSVGRVTTSKRHGRDSDKYGPYSSVSKSSSCVHAFDKCAILGFNCKCQSFLVWHEPTQYPWPECTFASWFPTELFQSFCDLTVIAAKCIENMDNSNDSHKIDHYQDNFFFTTTSWMTFT